jgi:hypothetical protein
MTLKEGRKAYYVDSLLFPATPCVIMAITVYDNATRRAMVKARFADGSIITEPATKFTTRKPAPYIVYDAEGEKKSFYDNAQCKTVSMRELENNFNHNKAQYAETWKTAVDMINSLLSIGILSRI